MKSNSEVNDSTQFSLEEKKRRVDMQRRIAFVIGGGLLIIFGALPSNKPSRTKAEMVYTPGSREEMAVQFYEFATEDMSSRSSQWQNPVLTWYERHFCNGRRTASYCYTIERALHPIIETLRRAGYQVSFNQKPRKLHTSLNELPSVKSTRIE